MEPIIAPVDKELIKAELTPDRFMRDTRKGGNKIYIIDCNNAPNVMREIGRLREIAFRYPVSQHLICLNFLRSSYRIICPIQSS